MTICHSGKPYTIPTCSIEICIVCEITTISVVLVSYKILIIPKNLIIWYFTENKIGKDGAGVCGNPGSETVIPKRISQQKHIYNTLQVLIRCFVYITFGTISSKQTMHCEWNVHGILFALNILTARKISFQYYRVNAKGGHLTQLQKIKSQLLRCTYIGECCVFPGPKSYKYWRTSQDEKGKRIAARAREKKTAVLQKCTM